MKPKSFILFALSAGCGLVAMLGVKQHLSSNQNEKPVEEMVKVLHATADITPNMPLDPNLIEFRELPKSAVPFGAVTSLEEYDGRALRSSAVPNEIIMKAKLTDKGAFDAATQIPAGMRVVSVPVNLTTSHSGMIRPTDRVDVICTFESPSLEGGKPLSTTKTILDYIEVFAIDRRTPTDEVNRDDILVKNVALLVTPQQAQLVMLALKEGQLHLALRSKEDAAVAETRPTDERSDLWEGNLKVSDRERENEEKLKQSTEQLALSEQEIADLKRHNDELAATIRQMQESNSTAVPVVVAPPKPKQKWELVIYSGSEQKKAEFELEEKSSDKKSEVNQDPLSAPEASGESTRGETQETLADPV